MTAVERLRSLLELAHREEPTDGRGFTVYIARQCFEALDEIERAGARPSPALKEIVERMRATRIRHLVEWADEIDFALAAEPSTFRLRGEGPFTKQDVEYIVEAALAARRFVASKAASPALKEIVAEMREADRHAEMGSMGEPDDPPTCICTPGEWADAIERAASLTAREQAFFEAAKEENWVRAAMSNFGKDPTTHMDEWHELSHAHMKAEKAMRAAYRALLEGPTQE